MTVRRGVSKVSRSSTARARARRKRAAAAGNASGKALAKAPGKAPGKANATERPISRCFYEWVPDGATVNSLEDKKLRLTRRILFLSRRWLNLIDNDLRAAGNSHARWVTLFWVGLMAGRAKLGELADQVGVELPTLVRLLNRLEREGLVERRSLGDSNRAKSVVLTPRGRRESAIMNDVVTQARAEFLRNVDEQQLTAALVLLDSLLAKYTRVVMWQGLPLATQ